MRGGAGEAGAGALVRAFYFSLEYRPRRVGAMSTLGRAKRLQTRPSKKPIVTDRMQVRVVAACLKTVACVAQPLCLVLSGGCC
jgi:hypothetical protein